MSDFIYSRVGGLHAPTEWAGSPWSSELQHGGPLCGLVASAAESAARETGLRVVRLTVDLCRPAPRAPLALSWRSVRRGRKLALIEVRLACGGDEVTRGTALLLAERSDLASAWRPDEPPPPGPDGIATAQFMPREYRAHVPPGFHLSIEVRIGEDELGPAAWVTTPLELVEGEATSPLVRAAMLSDLTFSLGWRLRQPRQAAAPGGPRVSLINADNTLYLERAPEGRWFAFRSAALSDHRGIGVAEVRQFDARGRFGRSLQALVANA